MAIATLTFQNVVDAARVPLNDAAKVRYPDPELLSYLNDGMLVLANYRPDLFTLVGEIVCVRNVTEQQAPPGTIALFDIYAVKNGPGITRIDLDTLRSFRPSWRTDPPGPAQNWYFLPSDPSKENHIKFGVYPAAEANQILIGQWSAVPTRVSNSALTLPVPDSYSPALQAYVVFRAETKDDEYVNNNRAMQGAQLFERLIGVAQAAEAATP